MLCSVVLCLDRGGYSRPKYTDVLWVQLVLLPYYIVHYICWWARWVWLFNIRRQEYGEEEKFYLIRKSMKYNKSQWDVSVCDSVSVYMCVYVYTLVLCCVVLCCVCVCASVCVCVCVLMLFVSENFCSV